jgi:hypothetical protein
MDEGHKPQQDHNQPLHGTPTSPFAGPHIVVSLSLASYHREKQDKRVTKLLIVIFHAPAITFLITRTM